jgi:hypothetical protein
VAAAKEKIQERAAERAAERADRAAEKATGKATGKVAGKAAGKVARGVGVAGKAGKAVGEQEGDEGNAGGAGGAGGAGDLGDLDVGTVTEEDVERWVDFYTGMHQQVQLLAGLRHRGTGAVIIAAGIHTLAPRGDEDWSRRLAQAAQCVAACREIEEFRGRVEMATKVQYAPPVVFCGDFNALPGMTSHGTQLKLNGFIRGFIRGLLPGMMRHKIC